MHGINDFSCTKGTGDKRNIKKNDEQTIAGIIDTLHKQDEEVQREIERDFSDINTLSDDKGTENLLAEAKDQNINAPLNVLTQNNGHEIAFWFFKNNKNVFDGASVVREVVQYHYWLGKTQ